MAKDWDKMDPYEQRMAISGIGRDFFDVEGSQNAREWGQDDRTHLDVSNDLAKKMGEDYDVREYLRYTGGDLPTTDEEMYNLHHAMKKDHKQNKGGAYNSRSDMSGVSARAFDTSRSNFKDEILEEVANSIPKQETKDAEVEEPVGASYLEHYGLEHEVAKATSGYNADGTPAQLNASALLSKTVKDLAYGPQSEKAHNNQDKYAMSFVTPDTTTLHLNATAGLS